MTDLASLDYDESRLSIIEGEVSVLKEALAKRDNPWNTAVIISMVALLLSIGTTAFSYFKEKEQYIHDTRTELRGLVQRLDRIPLENIEYYKKYESDQVAFLNISQALNAENALVAKQAYEVINLIPNYTEPTEYIAVGYALQGSYLFDMAAKMYKAGIDVVTDMNDEIALRRSYANLDFTVGNPEGGRAQYRDALQIFEKYPSSNTYLIETTHLLTEIQWAVAEASIRQCAFAREHIALAEKHLSSVAQGAGRSQFEGQYKSAKQNVDACVL
jgi:hypothetical protein